MSRTLSSKAHPGHLSGLSLNVLQLLCAVERRNVCYNYQVLCGLYAYSHFRQLKTPIKKRPRRKTGGKTGGNRSKMDRTVHVTNGLPRSITTGSILQSVSTFEETFRWIIEDFLKVKTPTLTCVLVCLTSDISMTLFVHHQRQCIVGSVWVVSLDASISWRDSDAVWRRRWATCGVCSSLSVTSSRGCFDPASPLDFIPPTNCARQSLSSW